MLDPARRASPAFAVAAGQRGRRRRRGDDARAARTPRPTRSDASSARTPGSPAVLHEAYPVRYWDHDLGPAAPHLFWAGQLPADEPAGRRRPGRAARPDARGRRRRTAPATTSRSPPTGGCSPAPRRCPTARPDAAPGSCSPTTADGETRALVDDPLADVYAPALLPRRRRAGLRPGDAVDLRRAAGLHAAARRRGRRHGPRPDPGLRPVAQRAAVQRRRHGGLLPRRRRRPARRSSGCPWPAARRCG